MSREWQIGACIGAVYRVDAADLGRVGNCWMKGRLREGDLVAPVAHTGDAFYSYQLVEGGTWFTLGRNPGVPAYQIPQGLVGVTFGAYALGSKLDAQPTQREWHMLMAGEAVNFTRTYEAPSGRKELKPRPTPPFTKA